MTMRMDESPRAAHDTPSDHPGFSGGGGDLDIRALVSSLSPAAVASPGAAGGVGIVAPGDRVLFMINEKLDAATADALRASFAEIMPGVHISFLDSCTGALIDNRDLVYQAHGVDPDTHAPVPAEESGECTCHYRPSGLRVAQAGCPEHAAQDTENAAQGPRDGAE